MLATSDYELIKQFVSGNQSAIHNLLERYKNKVYTYILLIVKEEHLAQDIFQDTYIKVVRSLSTGKYQENGKFLSWVLRIAHNLIIDHYRKKKQLPLINHSNYHTDKFNSLQYAEDTIESKMIDDQIIKNLKQLILELPADQQRIIMQRHYDGLSFKEIAEQSNISINTALGRMRYALINLRKIIAEKNVSLTRI